MNGITKETFDYMSGCFLARWAAEPTMPEILESLKQSQIEHDEKYPKPIAGFFSPNFDHYGYGRSGVKTGD